MESSHVDVLIVGAGLSGIGAACHLRRRCPGKSLAILESREEIGGTWDLFRYPGIRSDSDMFTLGYRFSPWREAKAIADGPAIREYIRETAREHGVDRLVRFGHRVARAEWSTARALWTVIAERPTGEEATITCRFLFACTGYYRYEAGHAPQLQDADAFSGQVVHPQHWPADLDYDGKRVVVIGSGATAVTLVPALAERAGHVTMLQRSPSYIVSLPARDPVADLLRAVLPAGRAHPVLRWKNALTSQLIFVFCRRAPKLARALIRRAAARRLPPGFDLDRHLSPDYEPWDQRLCIAPDGDFFTPIRAGRASIVTDRIRRLTEGGLLLESGEELEAEVIVTATGLDVVFAGGMSIAVDGREVDFSTTFNHKGAMFSGVPNLAVALGYTNASWTLKCDLVSEYVCRLINRMDRSGFTHCTPLAPSPEERPEPFIDLQAGYVLRAADGLPRQGAHAPWRLHQNYPRDVMLLRRGRLDDGSLLFACRDGRPVRVAALTRSA